MENLYIALLQRREFCPEDEWPDGIACYYDPGNISFATNETLSYCFLEYGYDDEYTIVSKDDCQLYVDMAEMAIKRLDRLRHLADANLPPDWPDGIHPLMVSIAKTLFRLHYFEPQHPFVDAMLKVIAEGKALSSKQIGVIKNIQQEYGSPEAMRQRQHTRWRLMRLAELELEPENKETVSEFIRYAQTPKGLRASKLPVIGALEVKYWEQRIEAARRRAAEINNTLPYVENDGHFLIDDWEQSNDKIDYLWSF